MFQHFYEEVKNDEGQSEIKHLNTIRYNLGESDNSVKQIKTRMALFIGLTGSGKSRIINLIGGHKSDSSMSLNPVSSNVHIYDNILINNCHIKLIDTIGLGDPKSDIHEITKQIEFQLMRSAPDINLVFVCLKFDRLRAKITEDINLIINDLRNWGMRKDQLVLLITFVDWFSNETIRKFHKGLRETGLDDWILNCRCFYVSTPKIDEVSEGFKIKVNELIMSNREMIINLILESDQNNFVVQSQLLDTHTTVRKWVYRLLYKYKMIMLAVVFAIIILILVLVK
jgi:GTPase Era involved in 16S rRNA processing